MAQMMGHSDTRGARDPVIAAFEMTAICMIAFPIVVVPLLLLAHTVPDVLFAFAFWMAIAGATAIVLGISQLYRRLASAGQLVTIIAPIVLCALLTYPVMEIHSYVSPCNGGPSYPFDRHPCESEGWD